MDQEDAKVEKSVDSPTSVLEDDWSRRWREAFSGKVLCSEKSATKVGEDVVVDAKNGDSSLISASMAEEEARLLGARVKVEDAGRLRKSEKDAELDDSQFTKLDELLSQTKLYTEFLLEKMEDITFNGVEQESNGTEPAKGLGRKRKAAPKYNDKKAKTAVAAMLTRSKENAKTEDVNLTEEERVEKEQKELVPLLTGGNLKSYQLKGVKWLISLWQNGLNGILADQMGLGKTIQTIGFLAHLKGKGLDGPYLVIAPLSTLSNWVDEIQRFVPSVDAIIYHGVKKQRKEIMRKHMPRSVGPRFPIIITSYEVAINDARRKLRHYNWKYIVVDEGHRLKNFQCRLIKELKHLSAENKLLLTGTPLQNNLAELWSLLNFILPDIFSSHEEFESWFDLSGKSNSGEMSKEAAVKRRAQMVAKLHAILRPFLLRRMKSDVEQMLPRKKEIILYATMTKHQKNFQEHLINRTLENHLLKTVSHAAHQSAPLIRRVHAGLGGTKGKLNNLMVQLRKNCNHPDLLASAYDGSYFYPPIEQIVAQCGKFRLLDRLLSKLFVLGHKVLIFSQWTKILDIMEYYFSEKGYEVCRIDGHVKLDERRRQIQEFNDVKSNYRIFILSTRAGGLGINLTAADTCILYDSDWNPQMDLQAMDRCHRIGQTKPVHVYRLATAQSVEGRILKRAFSKLKLEHIVIEKGEFHQERNKTKTLEEEDVLMLLQDDETAEDRMVQTDISDEDLEGILDRSDLVVGPRPDGADKSSVMPTREVPSKGPGWEVVYTTSGGMLSTLNS